MQAMRKNIFHGIWMSQQEAGFISGYESQPESFVLSDPFFYLFDKKLKTKTRRVSQKFIPEHLYTADFKLEWAEKARGIFFNGFADSVNLKKIPFIAKNRICHIEVKPDFDVHNMQREFSINQKWVFQKHGIYVQKVIPSCKRGFLFAKTFTPKKF